MTACFLALGLMGTIAAAAAGPGGGGIMPLADLFGSRAVVDDSAWNSREFSASRSNGSYIRYWFSNDTSGYCTVSLYRTELASGTMVVSWMTVDGNDNDWKYYYSSNASTGTYYIQVEATEMGGSIEGYASAAQYTQIPA